MPIPQWLGQLSGNPSLNLSKLGLSVCAIKSLTIGAKTSNATCRFKSRADWSSISRVLSGG